MMFPKRLLFIKFALLFFTVVSAQTTRVTGVVLGPEGTPLEGVSVEAKNTGITTVTKSDGTFIIEAPRTAKTLVVSHVGMVSQELSISGKSYSIKLDNLDRSLTDVVVIGYGKVKKSDLTGSVSTVNTREAFKAPVASLDQGLQGRAAGVQVTSISGAPGSGTTIRIRGGNSISAGNEPLFVIDGFIGAGTLSAISPDDIESIEILKDASATSIYGTRGANGVVLITTKRGLSAGKPEVNINSTIGNQQVEGLIKLQDAKEFAQFQNNGAVLNGSPAPYDLNNLKANTDWQALGYRKAMISNNTVSVTGGNADNRYYVSGNYFNQEGILKSNKFDRYSFRLNLDNKISKFLKIGTSLNYSYTHTDNPKYDAGALYNLNPLVPVKDSLNQYTYQYANGQLLANPFAYAESVLDETKLNNFLLNTNAEFTITKALSFRSSLGINRIFNNTNQYTPGSLPDRRAQQLGGAGSITNANSSSLLNENILSFDKKINSNNTLNAIAGFTVQSTQNNANSLSGSKLINDVTTVYALQYTDPQYRTIASSYSKFNLLSFLGRLNYSIKERYLFTASLRRDGSSKLGENNKWANFPSAAFAWRASDEPFLKNLPVISNLKLRTSYGLTGNQGIPAFSTLGFLASSTGILNTSQVTGVVQSTIENPNIKWETTRQFDVGLEMGLFNNVLNFEFDYYFKKTNDLLFSAEVPYITGFTNELQNIGSVQNKGVDIIINARIVSNKTFSWNASLNVSHSQNKILNLGKKTAIDGYTLPPFSRSVSGRLIVGQPLGVFWGYYADGINKTTGDLNFRDVNGDGQINTLDLGVIGNSNPKFFGGIQNSFRYKNIELNIFFQGTYGNDVYNTTLFNSSGLGFGSTYEKVSLNSWQPGKADALYVGPGIQKNIFSSNSSFVQDGSYFKLKTLTLSYTLPAAKWMNKVFKEVRVSFLSTNLWLLKNKNYLNIDPEESQFGQNDVFRGYDSPGIYPQNKSYSFGLNLKF